MALSPSRRGLLAIVGGTGAGQLIGVLSAPIIGRLFPPEVFGPFAVVNSLVFAVAPMAALRYDLAIPVPDQESEARLLASVGLRVSAWVAILGTVIMLPLHHVVASWLGLRSGAETLLLWVPLVAGLIGAFTTLNQFVIRQRQYSAIARRNLLQAAATVVLQVGAGLVGFGAHGLAAALAAGQAVGVLALARSLKGSLQSPDTRQNAGDRRAVMSRFRSFPLLLAPSGVINSLGLQAPVLLASSLFGASVAGWLGMTQRVLGLPVALFGLTLAQVFLGEFGAAKRGRQVDLRRLFVRTSLRLGMVGVLGAAVLLLTAPLLFEVFFSTQWRRSGVYAQALSVGLMFQMVASPLSQTIILMRRNHYQAIWDLSRLVLCSGSVFLGYRLGLGDVKTMWLLGAATGIMYLFLWGLSWRAVVHGTVEDAPLRSRRSI